MLKIVDLSDYLKSIETTSPKKNSISQLVIKKP